MRQTGGAGEAHRDPALGAWGNRRKVDHVISDLFSVDLKTGRYAWLDTDGWIYRADGRRGALAWIRPVARLVGPT